MENQNKGISTLVGIVIILVVIIVVGSIVIWRLQRLPKEEIVPQEDETADWKTYRNEEYGFEVKYPKDWSYGPNPLRPAPNMVFCPPELSDPDLGCSKEKETGDTLAPILLSVYGPQYLSGDVIGARNYREDPTGKIVYGLTISAISNESFGDIYEKMLSSFKFLELSEEKMKDETFGWETFQNLEYKYSLKCPFDRFGERCDVVSQSYAQEEEVSPDNIFGGILEIQVRTKGRQCGTELAKEVKDLDIKSYSEKIWQLNKNSKNPNLEIKVGDLIQTTVGGEKGHQFSISGGYEDDCRGDVLHQEYTYIFVANEKGDRFIFSYPTNKNELAQQILRTFWFLE